jgi:4-alpha-glucanotransferase
LCHAEAQAVTAAPLPAAVNSLGSVLGTAYDQNMPDWNKGRRAGIILHPTSLPGSYGIGELGAECFAFIDWLRSSGMQLWQVLPLVPPDPEYYSPYSGLDANCGNPLLVSIDALITEGLLEPSDAPAPAPSGDVDFEAVAAAKNPLLTKAAKTLLSSPKFTSLRILLDKYRSDNAWIEDSALFDALRQQPELEELDWWEWPEDLRYRKPSALKEAQKKFKDHIDEFVAIQFLFDRQWKAVKVSRCLVANSYAGTGFEAKA